MVNCKEERKKIEKRKHVLCGFTTWMAVRRFFERQEFSRSLETVSLKEELIV
jgi:hypothetical protein